MIKKVLIMALAILSLTACERRKKHDIMLLYPNWAEGIAITHLANHMLQEKGYIVDMKRIEPGPIYAALSRGDADVYMDSWLPHTHKDYWTRFGDRLEVSGVVFDDGITGLVVPTYVDINSIEELNAHKSEFEGGKIYGIAAGAGIHSNTEKAIKEYNLEYEQLTSSETSMITALKKAVANKEWIIITGWKPHYIWTMFDLKPLEDPKGVYPTDEIRIISRKGFTHDQPQIAAFLKKFSMNMNQLGELMNDISKDRDPKVGAKIYYEKHKEQLNDWLTEKEIEQ